MKISHEFPLEFYLQGVAESNTDYDYCLVHRYLDTPAYKEYMLKAKASGREIILDNSLYELGEAFDQDVYIEVAKELKPTYCILPDVFNKFTDNLDSQLAFYEKYKNIFLEYDINPMAIPHGITVGEIVNAIKIIKTKLPENTKIAIPFGSEAFNNSKGIKGFLSTTDISYPPLRQALNRNLFLSKYRDILCDRKIHLLGCKSLDEFGDWIDNAFFIDSIDTSLPVTMTFEGHTFSDSELVDIGTCKIIANMYKPTFLIDNHFNDKELFNNTDFEKLIYNIKYFKDTVNSWQLESV